MLRESGAVAAARPLLVSGDISKPDSTPQLAAPEIVGLSCSQSADTSSGWVKPVNTISASSCEVPVHEHTWFPLLKGCRHGSLDA